MGERKGQNMYYPPDYDPGKGGLNKSQGTHALRGRARKLHLGIMIIRFEMPYNIWCEGCGNHIGMGVRYNAEKKKVGMYYTTPVYLFRMKCHLCNNHFEIKTDPANLDYEIISGARRQEKRFNAEENGTVVPEERSAIAKIATDSMFKLQHDGIDRGKGRDAAPSINRIIQIQERTKDEYATNRRLRDVFRSKRQSAKAIEASNEGTLSRASLKGSTIKLLPDDVVDSRTAALLRLASTSTPEEKLAATRDAILEDGSIFDGRASSISNKSSTNVKSVYSKDKKIDEFKRMLARKRTHEGITAISSLNLGIVKKGKLTEAKHCTGHKRIDVLTKEARLEETKSNEFQTDVDGGEGITVEEKLTQAKSLVVLNECDTNSVGISKMRTAHSEVESSLKQISCDYGSSSSSGSDNE